MTHTSRQSIIEIRHERLVIIALLTIKFSTFLTYFVYTFAYEPQAHNTHTKQHVFIASPRAHIYCYIDT